MLAGQVLHFASNCSSASSSIPSPTLSPPFCDPFRVNGDPRLCHQETCTGPRPGAVAASVSLFFWDPLGAALSPNVLSGMSLPSPNGSTSSIISSEDSSSTTSATSTPRPSCYPPTSGHSLSQGQGHHYPVYPSMTGPLPHGSAQSYCQSHSHPGQVRGQSPSPSLFGSRPIKMCGVCGDRAKSYHFGGISCDSCKAFFRRSVQNDAYKNFHCPYEGQCDINISSRKCCQYCRFQKCLSIGMEKSWVMTEDERLQMLKSRLEKRQKQDIGSGCSFRSPKRLGIQQLKAEHEPDVGSIPSYLTHRDVNIIESLINQYLNSCKELPFKEELRTSKAPRSRTEILDMFFTAIQQFALFAQRIDSFALISPHDQELLLRGGALEMCFIRSAYLFDTTNHCWPDRKLCRETQTAPTLPAIDLKPLIREDLFEKHMNFIRSMKYIDADEPCIMLLSVVVLLSPDRPGLVDAELVSKEQEAYLILLKNYMNWRFGEEVSALFYPKLLLKLPDLRELAEGHTDYQLFLCREELEEVQHRLSNLKLDTSPRPVSKGAEGLPITACPWSLRRDVFANLAQATYCPEEELSTSSEGSERPSD